MEIWYTVTDMHNLSVRYGNGYIYLYSFLDAIISSDTLMTFFLAIVLLFHKFPTAVSVIFFLHFKVSSFNYFIVSISGLKMHFSAFNFLTVVVVLIILTR